MKKALESMVKAQTGHLDHPHNLIEAGRKLKELEHKLSISEAKRAQLIEGNIELKDSHRELIKVAESARFDLHIRKLMFEKLTTKQLSILENLELTLKSAKAL